MAYYDNPGTNPDEAVNVVNGKVFNVVQLADSNGDVVDPGGGGGTVEITNDEGNPIPVSGTVEITNDTGNPIPVSTPTRTPTTTSIPSSASSGLILTSNENRTGFSISNISTSKLYLSFSDPADIENCFIEIPAGAFILLDQQLIIPNAIYGFWAANNGAAQVTEYV